jgi:putative MATE family efflux protein
LARAEFSASGAELVKTAETASIAPAILKLALPIVAVLLIQISVGIAETYYVGRLGTASLAGAALVAPLVSLMTMMSSGGIGGGVASAVARAIGRGRRDDANAIAFQAVWIALLFGTIFTIAALQAGPWLYSALGGHGPVLQAALLYGGTMFANSIPIWLLNLLAASLRGAGDVKTPAAITLFGAILVIPLSPLLIFGLGFVPSFGIAGAGMAVGIYYVLACVILITRMRRSSSALVLRFQGPRVDLLKPVLRVGVVSAAGTIVTNLTTILLTGAAGLSGANALAGYGVAVRLDFLMIPLLFGFGAATTTLVGVSIGAGDPARAKKTAWTTALMAVFITGTVGVLVALWPQAWMGLFTHSPQVIAVGSHYLSIVGLTYGFTGVSIVLYFASQGAGRVGWPFLISLMRFTVSAGGGWYAAAVAHTGIAGVATAVATTSILSFLGMSAIVRFSKWGKS